MVVQNPRTSAARASRIDRNSLLPFYDQLRDILIGKLKSDWRAGDKLPSENELCDFYGVSRTVVRQALDELARERLIHKIKGKGSFVSGSRLDATFVQRAAGFHEEMVRAGHRVSSRTLEQKLEPASIRVASNLRISVDEPVVKLDRLRSVDDELVQVVRSYFPAWLFPGFEDLDVTDQSVYALLDERHDIRPHGGRRSIRTIPASPDDAKLLHVRKGTPLLLVESVTWASDGTPFEYFLASYRGDLTQFDLEVVAS